MLHRLGLWYWVNGVGKGRCFCKVRLNWLCLWLEDKANQ